MLGGDMRARIWSIRGGAVTSVLIGVFILVALALGITPAFAGPAAVSAAEAAALPAADAEEPVMVAFDATFDHYYINADGSEEQADLLEGSVMLSCAASECVLEYAAFDQYNSEPFAVPGSMTMNIPAIDACDAPIPWGPGVVSLEVTAEHVTGTHRTEPLHGDCGAGMGFRAYGYRWEILSSTLTEGACFFTEAGCAEAASTTESQAPEARTPIGTPEGESTSTSRLSSGDAAAPSVFSALATPAHAGIAPPQLALAALLTIVLVILVALPTSLLNSAVEGGSDRLSTWWRARRAQPVVVSSAGGAEHPPGSVSNPPTRVTGTWWWAACGVLAAAVISAFVDPELGFNAGSLRVLLSIIVSFGIDVMIGWMLTIWLMRRVAPSATHSFVFKPATLLVVLLAVVFARLTGFEPGIVFGLVAGVAFGALVGKDRQAKAALTSLGYAFGIALLAWVIYGLMPVDASFWPTFVRETLAAVAVGGMAALPIALIPLRGMAGHQIWAWRRSVWAGCYAVGLFAFFIVLMPMPFSWAGVSLDLWVWIGIYLAYAAVAVAAWLAISRPWRRDGGGGSGGKPPEPEPDVVAAAPDPARTS